MAVPVMMLSKSYGMFWVQTQPCTPELLEKSAATDHTVCVCVCVCLCVCVCVCINNTA